MVAVMRSLGHARFLLAGHDRGGSVALRLTPDHPASVTQVALIDCRQQNYDEWREATRNPDVVRAMLEDYRAGLTIDKHHEETDRTAGVRIQCPALILWSLRDDLEDLYGDPLKIWRHWAPDVRGHGIDSGHHVAEQAPEALATSLGDFFVSVKG
jgi:haloacetate dehalogenase